MKTLAIFGDSFGHDEYNKTHKSWVDYIREFYSVTNFSESASSLWFSYKNFLAHHQKFEKIIFLVTSFGRVSLPKSTNLKISKHIKSSFSSAIKKNEELKKDVELVEKFYLNIFDEEKERSHDNLMIAHITNLRPDAILYPCFKERLIDTKDFPLAEINFLENKSKQFLFSLEKFTKMNIIDQRCCHITEPNHKVVANMFLKKLENEEYYLKETDIILKFSQSLIKFQK